MDTGKKGKLFIVGIGPGSLDNMTERARDAINSSDTVVGYTRYIELIKTLIDEKEVISTGMTREIERCKIAIEKALQGNTVSLICSGDPGIYALAGLVMEILKESYKTIPSGIELSIVPGVPAFAATASLLGAPLMHDFVLISLSDRLTPWEVIEKRLHAASEADFVIVLYNPRSKGRKEHLKRAVEIISRYRKPSTPVGIVKAASRPYEEILIAELDNIPFESVDMESTVIIGNSTTFRWNNFIITPRGYSKKYNL